MASAKRHLVAKLKRLLDDIDIELRRTTSLPHPMGARGGAAGLELLDEDRMILAVHGHSSAEELVATAIHGLLHFAGYPEEAVDEALDRAMYASPSLRAAVAIKLLGLALKLPA